jgi:hypothetical protein
VKLYAKPVFAASTYNEAVANYKKSTGDQETATANYKSRSAETVLSKRAEMGYTPNNYTGFRTVSVVRTGIYNCDYPLRVNNNCYNVAFREDGQTIVPAKIYWTDKDVNAMYQTEGTSSELCIVKGATIVMWAVDAQSRIAVVSSSDFAKATRKNDNPVFDLVFQESREGLETLHSELYGENYTASIAENSSQVLSESVLPSVTCFPNPATDVLNVSISGNTGSQNSQLLVINSKGQVIMPVQMTSNNETLALNVTSLAPGIYFLQLSLQNGRSVSKRFVKQ